MKVELILEGGGMRGVYTAGVLDFFMDMKLKFKDITAVSAGVCIATSYVSNQRGRSLKIFTDYSKDKRYLSVSSLVKTGSAFGIDFIFRTIPDELLPFDYDEFQNSDMKMTAVCTDYKTGKAVYVLIDDLRNKLDYVIASSSLPLASKVVKVDNLELLDGGVVDPIPVKHSLDKGFDLQVLVLTRDVNYRKSKSLSNRIVATKFRRHKAFAYTLKNRHVYYNDSLDIIKELEDAKKAIVIRPSRPVFIERFEKDPIKLKQLYDLGYQDAKAKYEVIIKTCQDCDNIEYEKEDV
jgi:predicted patatin/cPLA2 family phospholipase